jgi:hypothetical protein
MHQASSLGTQASGPFPTHPKACKAASSVDFSLFRAAPRRDRAYQPGAVKALPQNPPSLAKLSHRHKCFRPNK